MTSVTVSSCINRNGSPGNPAIRMLVGDSVFHRLERCLCLRALGGLIPLPRSSRPRSCEADRLAAGPSPCQGSAQTVSGACQVAMETDLEIAKTGWYLLGICSFLGAVTNVLYIERDTGRQTDRQGLYLPLPHL